MRLFIIVLLISTSVLLNGCGVSKKLVAEKDQELARRGEAIEQKEQDLAGKEQQIAEYEQLIAQKDEELNKKTQEITKKNTLIDQLQKDIDKSKQRVGSEQKRVDKLNEELTKVLGNLQQQEKVWLKEKEGLSTITMPNAATFASGSTNLTAEGKAIIDTVWSVLIKFPNRDVFIEGHTDSMPIGPELRKRFKSNWELSAGRALEVLQYVLSKHEAEATRLAAVGFGEFRPVADNASEEGRAQNRRVIISIRPAK
ncbi:MAG: OmpA family protein [Candidatus Latescibacterota bacterium]